ncbi:MAG: hypothetical protein EHM81_11410, partial [Chloroflexi bacterium]
MLTELRIENFAIIDRLELDFAAGLIIFTGETGAGNSIIMDALEMLLGGRADTTVLRTDAERANVEASSNLPAPPKRRSMKSFNVKTCWTMKTTSPWRAK